MEIRIKISNLLSKLKQTSRVKLIGFTFLGLIILTLVVEGGYFLYSRTKKQEVSPWGKPSSFFGKELAVDLGRDQQKGEEEGVLAGVRELPNGQIGISGHFVSATTDSLTIEVKGKEVTVPIDSKTSWRKFYMGRKETPVEEREFEPALPEEFVPGDWIDVICLQSEEGLKTLGILMVR